MTTRQPTPGVHENFASQISSSPDPQSQKWCPWNGGDMPVPRGTAVEVILRYGKQVIEQAGGGYATRWSHDGPMGGHDDIVFYRLYTPAPQSHLGPLDTLVAAWKAHIDAVATYNARREYVRSLPFEARFNLDAEWRATTVTQSAFIKTAQDIAQAALATTEGSDNG